MLSLRGSPSQSTEVSLAFHCAPPHSNGVMAEHQGCRLPFQSVPDHRSAFEMLPLNLFKFMLIKQIPLAVTLGGRVLVYNLHSDRIHSFLMSFC